MTRERVVLVTGASSGIGRAIAHHLVQDGYRVFGTSRKPAIAASVLSATRGIEMLMLDVCSDDSVTACVQMVMKQAGRLDVLVNNAGHNLIGGIEETSMEEAKSQFETNFFGVVRMTKAVLPMMRHQRDGHIINISSLGGLIPLVFGAFYSASKFALEAYTECLRHELKSFNVRVSLLEPGTIKTGSLTYIQEPRQPLEAYDAMRKGAFQVIRHSFEKGDHPARVAGFVSHILQSRAPKLRYPTGQDVAWLPRIKNLVPDVLWERGARKMFKLDEERKT